jgi:hypothetical protein
MADPELIETLFPGLQIRFVIYCERNVVKSRPEFAEPRLIVRHLMRVQSERSSPIQTEYNVVEAVGIFVQYRLGPEELLVPISTPIEIRNRYRYMSESWEPSH